MNQWPEHIDILLRVCPLLSRPSADRCQLCYT